MNRSQRVAAATRAALRGSFLLATAAAISFAAPAWAEEEKAALSEDDAACLKCHNQEGFKTTLPDGRTRSLYVSEKAFAASVHRDDGCAACHNEEGEECLDKAKDGNVAASKRQQSIDLMKGCVVCHKVAAQRYDKSVHSALLKKAGEKADKTAVCSDCHSVHAERFFDAKNKCITCHEEPARQHRDWLPRAERHLETVACEACHSPSAQRRLNLRLYDGESPLTASAGVPQFKKVAADAKPASLDARALWSLLQEFNRGDAEGKTVLRGRLEARSAAEGHEVADKSKAIKACDTCHSEGSDAFKSVTVSVVGPDGKPLHAAADKSVLTSLESLESIGGFYVLGATRIKLLDHLLLLTVVAGAGVPIGHLSLRLLSRWIRARRAPRGEDKQQ